MKTRYSLRKDGKLVIEVIEGQGPDCLERTRSIERRFGKVVERTLKPEHEQTETQAEQERLHG